MCVSRVHKQEIRSTRSCQMLINHQKSRELTSSTVLLLGDLREI